MMAEMNTMMASAPLLASAVTEEEWREIPAEIRKKLQNFVEERIDELLTTKALLETYKFNTGIDYPIQLVLFLTGHS